MHESKTDCFLFDLELFISYTRISGSKQTKISKFETGNNKIQEFSVWSTTHEMVTFTRSVCVFKIEARSITYSSQP